MLSKRQTALSSCLSKGEQILLLKKGCKPRLSYNWKNINSYRCLSRHSPRELPLTVLKDKMKKPLHCRISTYWKYLKRSGQSWHLGRVNCCKVNKKITFLKAPSGKEAPLWNEKPVIHIKSPEHNLVAVYTANKTLKCVKSGRHIYFFTVPLFRKAWSIWVSLSNRKHTRNNRSSEYRQNNTKMRDNGRSLCTINLRNVLIHCGTEVTILQDYRRNQLVFMNALIMPHYLFKLRASLKFYI